MFVNHAVQLPVKASEIYFLLQILGMFLANEFIKYKVTETRRYLIRSRIGIDTLNQVLYIIQMWVVVK